MGEVMADKDLADMSDEELFDTLFDTAADVLSAAAGSEGDDFDVDEYEDELGMFAAYFAAKGGQHLRDVAEGDEDIDDDMVKDLLDKMELSGKGVHAAAIENLTDLAEAVVAYLDGDDEGDDDDGKE